MIKMIVLFLSKFSKKLDFGRWLDGEEIRQIMIENIRVDPNSAYNDTVLFCQNIVKFPVKWLMEHLYWENSIAIFMVALMGSRVTVEIPLTQSKVRKMKDGEISWDYKGRNKFYLYHIFIKAYGWTVEYIRSLNPNHAMQLLQEILVDEQLEKEFSWSLSEIAYPYNKSTKKSEYKPMPRPIWMQPEVPKVKIIRMPKSILPVGVVNDAGGMEEYVKRITNEMQEANPETNV